MSFHSCMHCLLARSRYRIALTQGAMPGPGAAAEKQHKSRKQRRSAQGLGGDESRQQAAGLPAALLSAEGTREECRSLQRAFICALPSSHPSKAQPQPSEALVPPARSTAPRGCCGRCPGPLGGHPRAFSGPPLSPLLSATSAVSRGARPAPTL